MRDAAIADFLARAGWAEARRMSLAGDASNRRYDRLARDNGETAVLMDADPATGEDVRPFLAIARHLSSLGFSAPAILAEDSARGLLLLEDLGDDLFARLAARAPQLEEPLYAAATDLLARLHRAPLPEGLASYGPAEMAELGCLPFRWYLPGQGLAAPEDEIAAVRAGLETLLAEAAPASVLILRDYHAENLLWLPERDGVARVGLLDFQDARIGHPAYDLVSLLQDARRDVSPGVGARMRARYVAATGTDAAAFDRACAVAGAQRNLRIIGVFARLCLRDGKPGYLSMLPRVWGHLMRDLDHPALAGLRDTLQRLLPPPEPDRLDRIASRCAPRR
ncbi:phosphotransferase [Rhodovulum sulfidophilum]|uniref:aminoglycoside phosphotransferase family protein n=1 Tax=Rhodovulum sulfidophilum TaxID=35806 RepID=UPI001920A19A|nr:phosphotransferase [Rhodovulum sulfidophilum]MBL3594789.1 phosphotransferase [Rhodovulum sulfidophilum]